MNEECLEYRFTSVGPGEFNIRSRPQCKGPSLISKVDKELFQFVADMICLHLGT